MEIARFDVAIVGAGPSGLACAIETQRAGLSHIVLEKGCLVNSLVHYPINMVFFTTPELLEIGDLPMVSAHEKPTRLEGLKYYRRVTDNYGLNIHQYEGVDRVEGADGDFTLATTTRVGHFHEYGARKVVIATGYYDHPNRLVIPGENLSKVSHYYTEAHPYYDQEVAVIGGKNSAVEAALDLYRNGARVTLLYRGPAISDSIKYWIKPDIENRIQRGEITAYFSTRVTEIKLESLIIDNPDGQKEIKNDFVFAMTGYHPDDRFLRSLGVDLNAEDLKPRIDPETFETNVPGIYVAGSIVAGNRNNEIFIENGRFHGKAIMHSILHHP